MVNNRAYVDRQNEFGKDQSFYKDVCVQEATRAQARKIGPNQAFRKGHEKMSGGSLLNFFQSFMKLQNTTPEIKFMFDKELNDVKMN